MLIVTDAVPQKSGLTLFIGVTFLIFWLGSRGFACGCYKGCPSSINVNTADARRKAKESINLLSAAESMKPIFGMKKGGEFTLTREDKEKKYRAINAHTIQVIQDNSGDNMASSTMSPVVIIAITATAQTIAGLIVLRTLL